MAEPEDDPPPHPSLPGESSASPVRAATRPEVLAAAPRANPPSVFNPKDGPAAPPPASVLNDLIAWLQMFAASHSAPVQRTTLPKQEKKFHRYDPEAPKSVREGIEAGLKPSGHADLPPASGEPTVVRKRRLKPASLTDRHGRRWLRSLLVRVALVSVIFMVGRWSASDHHPAATSTGTRASMDRAEPDSQVPHLIDQAMAAENRMDFAKATELLQTVQREKSRVTGVDYHLALLAFESGDNARVLPLLNQSIEKGEEVAACYNLRGTLSNRVNGGNRGLDDLQTATLLDPFNAKYFYFAGEALRRAGKPMEALRELRQASDRARDPALQSLYDLKVRLTQIELGQETEFTDRLATELQRTPPSIDWLFTAAAVSMHEHRFDDAGGYFDRVLSLTDQATANTRLRDYFFYGYANEKPLARFFAPMPPSTSAPAHP